MKLSEGGTLLLVILGWAATHFLSEARERRKEVRAKLDLIYKALRDLQDAAHAFHSADVHDAKAAQRLRSDIYWLQRALTRIPALDEDELAPSIVALRRAVTLRNFDPSAFATQSEGSEILEGIVDAVADFEDELERQYGYHYPGHFPFFRVRPWRTLATRIRQK